MLHTTLHTESLVAHALIHTHIESSLAYSLTHHVLLLTNHGLKRLLLLLLLLLGSLLKSSKCITSHLIVLLLRLHLTMSRLHCLSLITHHHAIKCRILIIC